jgi:hypothetical protein
MTLHFKSTSKLIHIHVVSSILKKIFGGRMIAYNRSVVFTRGL